MSVAGATLPPPSLESYLPASDHQGWWECTGLLGTSLALSVAYGRAETAPAHLTSLNGGEVRPGPEVSSDAEIDEFLRNSCETAHHPAGTCRMGADDEAVVDGELKVKGIDGLRVADCSIMPNVVGSNTNAPTIMIAEKAADMIRGHAPPPAWEGS